MKKATLALAGLVAITSAANASMSRWNGFGAAQAFIADVQDIWTLPAVVASNSDATYLEFGTPAGGVAPGGTAAISSLPTGVWGGAHGKLGPGVLGIWYGRPWAELSNNLSLTTAYAVNANGTSGVNPTAGVSGAVTALAFLAPINQIDVLYGFDLNEQVQIGVGITSGTNSIKTENTVTAGTTSTERTASSLGINLGADIKEVGPIKLLEIGLQYDMPTSKVTGKDAAATYNDKITMTGTDMDLRVGGDIAGEDGAFQRVELGFNTDALTVKAEPMTAAPATAYSEGKASATAWNLGWAMGKSSDKGMGLGGLILTGVSQMLDAPNATGANTTEKLEISSMSLVAMSAGETKIKEWISARAGVSGVLYYSEVQTLTTGPNAAVVKDTLTLTNPAAGGGLNLGALARANAILSTGLSLHFGDITIDGVLNQDLLYTGPFFTNGIPEALFGQVSATWAWGGAKE